MLLSQSSAAGGSAVGLSRRKQRQKNWKLAKQNYMLYLFVLPALLYILIFCYWPMYGIIIAFKDYKAVLGIWGSPWAGFKYFQEFFSSYRFWTLLWNTLSISLYSLIAGFPMPIILALILNYVKNQKFKKFAQTATYAPHFISTVIMVSMLFIFLSPRTGMVNSLLAVLGAEPVYFMGTPGCFRHIYVWSGIWQGTGWGSIIYMAALAGVSPELHEAAIIDGATKIKRIWHIDLPTILPTTMILLIMNMGSIMSIGFEKVFLMQTDLTIGVSEIISTYVYKMGLVNARYDYSTAIGLFNNVINFILLVLVNKVAKRLSGTGLW